MQYRKQQHFLHALIIFSNLLLLSALHMKDISQAEQFLPWNSKTVMPGPIVGSTSILQQCAFQHLLLYSGHCILFCLFVCFIIELSELVLGYLGLGKDSRQEHGLRRIVHVRNALLRRPCCLFASSLICFPFSFDYVWITGKEMCEGACFAPAKSHLSHCPQRSQSHLPN